MERKDVDCESARIVAASASGEINQHQYSPPVDNNNIKTAKELQDLPFFIIIMVKIIMVNFKDPWGWVHCFTKLGPGQCLVPIEANKIWVAPCSRKD